MPDTDLPTPDLSSSLATFAAQLHTAQLESLRAFLNVSHATRVSVSYYPAYCAEEVLVTSVETTAGEQVGMLLDHPEHLHVLQRILHADHHTSYEEAHRHTTRLYHWPAEQEWQHPPKPPLLIIRGDGNKREPCHLIWPNGEKYETPEMAQRIAQMHEQLDGKVLWRDGPPAGTPEFWQRQLRRGIEP